MSPVAAMTGRRHLDDIAINQSSGSWQNSRHKSSPGQANVLVATARRAGHVCGGRASGYSSLHVNPMTTHREPWIRMSEQWWSLKGTRIRQVTGACAKPSRGTSVFRGR